MRGPDSFAAPAEGAALQVLPPLPYALTALEPYIDARTMALHYGEHHAGYVRKLNLALEGRADLLAHSAEWLLCHADAVPSEIRSTVRKNAGGHLNHSLFWQTMAPATDIEPSGNLAAAIDATFGGLEPFKREFEAAGAGVFGSGWVWLVRVPGVAMAGQELAITTTTGHGNPLEQGKQPILLNDVWEHAYYLKHENRRAEYLKNWWPIVNWAECSRRFERSQ